MLGVGGFSIRGKGLSSEGLMDPGETMGFGACQKVGTGPSSGRYHEGGLHRSNERDL